MSVNRWFVIRLGMVVLLAIGAAWQWDASNWSVDWQACWIVPLAFALTTYIGLTVLGKASSSSFLSWTKPSWSENPFQPRAQPLQFWHQTAFDFLGTGLGGIIAILSRATYSQLPATSLVTLVGLGIWAAVRVWVLKFLTPAVGRR